METGQNHKNYETRREFERLQRKPTSSKETAVPAPVRSNGAGPGSGPGTRTRIENVGSGYPLLKNPGISQTFDLKTILAGTNVTISEQENTITIESTSGGSLPPGTINQTLRHTGVGASTWEATSRLLVKSTTPPLGGGSYGVEVTSPIGETARAFRVFAVDGSGIECMSKNGSEFINADGTSNIVLKASQVHGSADSISFFAANYSEITTALAIQAQAYKKTLYAQTMFLHSLNENTYSGYFVNNSGLNSGYRGIGIYATATGIRKRAAQFDLSTADISNVVVEVNTPSATKGIVVNAPGAPRQTINDNAGISVYCSDSSHLALLTDGYIHSFGRINTNSFFSVLDVDVVGERKTGWATATGTATRTTFDTATVTLPQLAQRLKALLDDLFSHGLIGT
jgi:hypothetical protein